MAHALDCAVPGACLLMLMLAQQQTPLTIGETFTIPSQVLNETRTINVYRRSWSSASRIRSAAAT